MEGEEDPFPWAYHGNIEEAYMQWKWILRRLWRVMKWIWTHLIVTIGTNSDKITKILQELRKKWEESPLKDWGKIFKDQMKPLDKKEFNEFRSRGLQEMLRTQKIASRGYFKIQDMVKQTGITIYGRVLNLCCGRAGWEEFIAPMPQVKYVRSVTLGPGPSTPKHEKLTSVRFEGREKCNFFYGDARQEPPGDYDWILYDGGEDKPDPNEVAQKNHRLLVECVAKHVKPGIKFLWKVLCPWYPETIEYLEKVQNITGKGGFVLCSQSRVSNCELYFVSINRTNLRKQVRALLMVKIDRAILGGEGTTIRPPEEVKVVHKCTTIPGVENLPPISMKVSLDMLGPTIAEPGRSYLHWKSLGVYPYGTTGTAGQSSLPIVAQVMAGARDVIPGLDNWKLTDTTPRGFFKVFKNKVDTSPEEFHNHWPVMKMAYDSLLKWHANFQYHVLTPEEIVGQANPAGAKGVTDGLNYNNVAEFLSLPDWELIVHEVEEALLAGKPMHAVWTTQGKREKKKTGHEAKGSRMIAFLPIPMRIIELKYLGSFMSLVKPEVDQACVGGVGLHDLGERMKRLWKQRGIYDDVAGWDTRVPATMLDLEHYFLQHLVGKERRASSMIRRLYQIYKRPHILIPMEGPYKRSELLEGFGQRMSGSLPTYVMNTKSREALLIAMTATILGMTTDEVVLELNRMGSDNTHVGRLSAMISGDDCNVFMNVDDAAAMSEGFWFTNEMGFIRKDINFLAKTPVQKRMEDMEFCSHRYERVTYYDSYNDRVVDRYMPTRDVSEILAKSSMWLNPKSGEYGELAWMTTQGSNLLVLYHHMRLPRLVGFMYKAIAPDNLLLTGEGPIWKKTPWLKPGKLIDIINEVLFGASTMYPVPGFQVREFRHLGYLSMKREASYIDTSLETNRALAKWKKRAIKTTKHLNHRFGGDTEYLEASGVFSSERPVR